MGSKMLIDASHPEETRVVVLRGNRIEEFDFESASRRQLKGNIYLAKVTRVEPSLQAAFVEYGGNRHGFLAFSEIHPDYYQIPLADRQALLREQEEAEHDDDDNGDHNGHNGHHGNGRSGRDERAAQPDADAEADDEAPRSEALVNTSSEETLSETVSVEEIEVEESTEAESGEPELPLSEQAGEEASAEKPEAEPEVLEAVAPAPTIEHGMPGELGNGVETVEEDPESQKVESVGAEDALDELPQRRRKQPRRQYKIQEVIKRRQVILVQVVKEERGNKGAALTTYLSLAGRYCVLMPNTARGGGISRKITDSGDRRRLKEVAKDIEVPQGMGLIVRTAGATRTKTEIKRDYDYLLRLWESVRDLTLSSTAPALVYEEGNLIKRAIRDLYTKDVEEVYVEGEPAYREAKSFMKMLMPSHAKNVKLYKDSRPLLSRFQAESQLDGLYSPTVTLPSGGYMVINQTEALVAVDINSGKSTREHNIEDTALRTNLEAADEIARQLRLRDLAGLIVIDFIDMEEKRNNRAVERRLKEALKDDRARIQVGRISHFGLLEMSRQRLRPGLLEGSSRTCPHCEGRGIVRSISSCGLSVLRAIEEHLMARKPENLTVKCSPETAFYILNEKRDNLLTIETSYGISIFIVPTDDVKGSQAIIERATDRNIPPRRVNPATVQIDSAFQEEVEEPEVEEAVEEEEEQTEASSQERDSSEGEGQQQREGGGRRRRRRGRRGGRRDREDSRGENGQQMRGPSPEAAEGDIPGLGDQPEIDAVREAPDEDGEASEASPESKGEGSSERSHRFGRRGRHGRRGDGRRDGRGRDDRNREDRQREERPHASQGEAREQPAMAEVSESPARAERAERPAPVVEAPVRREEPSAETAEEIQARKWQPPQPTIEKDAVPRKTGWWGRR